MRLVVDTNIFFAAFIKNGLTAKLLADSRLRLYAPDHFLEEIQRYVPMLMEKTRRTEDEVHSLLEALEHRIDVIPKAVFGHRMSRARTYCPDPEDVPFFALCLHLDCPLWSNDKKLKQQDKVTVLNTREIWSSFKR